jgi:hypothetical protein
VNRLEVYTVVHKMQRARLFDLTVALGKSDPADSSTSLSRSASPTRPTP